MVSLVLDLVISKIKKSRDFVVEKLNFEVNLENSSRIDRNPTKKKDMSQTLPGLKRIYKLSRMISLVLSTVLSHYRFR